MKQQFKATYRKRLSLLFAQIQSHPLYTRMRELPLVVRILMALPLFCIGLIALVTPIPAGWLMILTACVLVFDLQIVQRYSVRLFFSLQIHRLMDRIYRLWRGRQR